MTIKIGYIDSGNAFGVDVRPTATESISISKIPQYNLHTEALCAYDVLMFPNFVDQEYLYSNRNIVKDFLDAKKIVVFQGHLFKNWLPGAPLFMPQPVRDYNDYKVYPHSGSSVFKGVTTEDMTFNKGVAGFFARGYYNIYGDQEAHLSFKNGNVVTYEDRRSTQGLIFVHGGRPLLNYQEQGKSTDRIRPQFISWLIKETAVLQGEKVL
ncbi:hypothetical protein [Salinicoccus halodurans]|uniref:Phosphate starvation-inducible protein PhoH n=1 Tax=Salinicoccus halodurans TaxID=407035 RepID=A0A0F7HIG0_9STAP|nr:hypothetical protein [Salinicoccus halodurans]AKG72843.1 hypothetical protein AAT16_00570 [Salinicoccus halodurans]SFK75020.1 hypothetical protein SAMN05216235_1480 [Salinicoccus halodurans]